MAASSFRSFSVSRSTSGSGAFGRALPESDGREGRLDGVRGPWVDPVLGGAVPTTNPAILLSLLGGVRWSVVRHEALFVRMEVGDLRRPGVVAVG